MSVQGDPSRCTSFAARSACAASVAADVAAAFLDVLSRLRLSINLR